MILQALKNMYPKANEKVLRHLNLAESRLKIPISFQVGALQSLKSNGIFFVNTSQNKKHFLRSAFLFWNNVFRLRGT